MSYPPAERGELRLPLLTISLPAHDDPKCLIMVDLAELFGLEFNREALDVVRQEWKTRGLRGRVEWDHEADYVFVSAGREAIVSVAALIHEVCGVPLSDDRRRQTLAEAKAYRRPQPPPERCWREGDVFAIRLDDGAYAFGQVLRILEIEGRWQPKTPVVAVFEHHAQTTDVDLLEVVTSRTLSVFREGYGFLTDERPIHLGGAPVLVDPGLAKRHDWAAGAFTLPRAWFGHEIWNNSYIPDDLDRRLLPGVSRPATARVLSQEEWEAMLEARGGNVAAARARRPYKQLLDQPYYD